MLLPALLWTVAGCGGVDDPGRAAVPEPATAPVAPAPDAVVSAPTVITGRGEAIPIELQFKGVGALFQGFFADAELVGVLAGALGGCLEAERAVILITWSEETRVGSITVETEPDELRCRGVVTDAGTDLSGALPIAAALAQYRDGVSGRYDVRLASFKTGLRVLAGLHHCAFWTGGQYPPDGSTFSRCAEFAGNRVCAPGDPAEGVTRATFGAEHDAAAKACFGG